MSSLITSLILCCPRHLLESPDPTLSKWQWLNYPFWAVWKSESLSVSFCKWLSFPQGVISGFLIPSLEDSPSVLCLLWRFLVSACWWAHLWPQGSSPCSNCLEYSLFPRGGTFPDIYSHREQSLCPQFGKHLKTLPSILLLFFFFF